MAQTKVSAVLLFPVLAVALLLVQEATACRVGEISGDNSHYTDSTQSLGEAIGSAIAQGIATALREVLDAVATGNTSVTDSSEGEAKVFGNNAILRGHTRAFVVGNNADVEADEIIVDGDNANIKGNTLCKVKGNNAIVDCNNANVTGKNPRVTGNNALICSDIGNKVSVTGDDINITVVYKYHDEMPSQHDINPDNYDNRVVVSGVNATVVSSGENCLRDIVNDGIDYNVEIAGRNMKVKVGGEEVTGGQTTKLGNTIVINIQSIDHHVDRKSDEIIVKEGQKYIRNSFCLVNGNKTTVFCQNATVHGNNAKVSGNNAKVTGDNADLIGIDGLVNGNNAKVIGFNSSITGVNAVVYGNNVTVKGDSANVTGKNPRVTGNNALICSDIGNNVTVTGDDIDIKVIYKYQDGRPSQHDINPDYYDNRVVVSGFNAKVFSSGEICFRKIVNDGYDYNVEIAGRNMKVNVGDEEVTDGQTTKLGNTIIIN